MIAREARAGDVILLHDAHPWAGMVLGCSSTGARRPGAAVTLRAADPFAALTVVMGPWFDGRWTEAEERWWRELLYRACGERAYAVEIVTRLIEAAKAVPLNPAAPATSRPHGKRE
jgi:hypothetical protein